MTISPVMEVLLRTDRGDDRKAVLKLCRRRFGPNRQPPYEGRIVPYTREREVAWQEYVSSGLAEPLLAEIKHEGDVKCPGYVSENEACETAEESDTDDEPKSRMEELGGFECFVYHLTQKQYNTEVKAYRHLKALPGRCVPKFISSVHVYSQDPPDGLPPTYFQVFGILIEFIPGFSLRSLTWHVSRSPELCTSLIQEAVDLTIDVNRAGVFNFDCQPRNFVVKELGER